MANLTYIEKSVIENLLGMKTGYVLDFSDRTFQEFVAQATGCDILSERYNNASNSKANRLRAFLKIEPNYTCGQLLSDLCQYWLTKARSGEINYQKEETSFKECLKLVERLKSDNIVEHIDSIKPNSDDRDFGLLAKSIKESIEKNQPEVGLDRLHTFTVKYVRQLCDNHGLTISKDEALHSLFGKYVKHVVNNKLIESAMTERILKFSINIIDAFNDVRNNNSFAHDNPILNYHESILIFNNISNTVKFIESVEAQIQKSKEPKQTD